MGNGKIEIVEELIDTACKVINEMVVTDSKDERYELALMFRAALSEFTEGARPWQ